jgi:hypothetical protein
MGIANDVLRRWRAARVGWRTVSAIRRTVVLLGSIGMIAGAGLLTAGFAQAASDPSGVGRDASAGTLTFVDHSTQAAVTSGPGTELLNWQTSDPCPSPDNVSATIATFNADTGSTPFSLASNTAQGPGPYAGSVMQATVANLFADWTDGSSDTFEVAVLCTDKSTGSTTPGTYEPYQYAYITYNPSSKTFAISATGTGTPPPTSSPTPTATPTPTPTDTSTGTPTPTPTDTSTGTASPTPTDTSTGTASPTPTDTSTGTAAPIPTATSSVLPSGAPATGAGGASLPGNGKMALTGLGATLLAGSAASIGLALRRKRKLPWVDEPDQTRLGGNS